MEIIIRAHKIKYRKITILGKERNWYGVSGSYPYKVIYHKDNEYTIIKKYPDDSWRKEVLHFISDSIYWVNWKDNSDINLREYFVKEILDTR